jgi:hypothetical protein
MRLALRCKASKESPPGSGTLIPERRGLYADPMTVHHHVESK